MQEYASHFSAQVAQMVQVHLLVCNRTMLLLRFGSWMYSLYLVKGVRTSCICLLAYPNPAPQHVWSLYQAVLNVIIKAVKDGVP